MTDNPFAPSQTAPPELDPAELHAPGTVCFRLRRGYWITVFCCAAIFFIGGTVYLVVPIDPIQGPSERIALGTTNFAAAILSLTPIAWFMRVGLWFTPQSVVYRGLSTQMIRNADIHSIVWRINRFGAVIEIHGPARLIHIRLESFEWKDQNAMIAALRHAFPLDIQSGWSDAFEMRLAYVERG